MSQSASIFALASGRLPAGVAVVRLSGSRVRFAVETIFGSLPEPRYAAYGTFRDLGGNVVDRGLCLFFPGPKSFTGEDVAEFHMHGGPAVVRVLGSILASMGGFRQAQAGEFIKRGFLNGKLALTEAEGLGDLIRAESEAQRRWAMLQSDGQLQRLYEGWRSEIVRLRAMSEASIDFSDEDDVSSLSIASVTHDAAALAQEMARHLDGFSRSETIRNGFSVVVIGAPNAGKSSLVNALAGRDVAIASDEPGTTRDLIDVRLEIDGNLVILTDTAGLREDAGRVEMMGIERARQRSVAADLVLMVSDVSDPVVCALPESIVSLVRVGTKIDLVDAPAYGFDVLVSSASGQGLDALVRLIGEHCSSSLKGADLMPGSPRQVEELRGCVDALWSAGNLRRDLELIAEDLRVASDHIGRLTGRVDIEDLLDVVFSKFCIGK